MAQGKKRNSDPRTVVCPNCNTELRSMDDQRPTTVICPECDTHVPIARA